MISVGNLVLGGSGKTPVVVALTRLLQQMGERPAILSRGYGRRSTARVAAVCTGAGPLLPVTESGDEPQMLARAVPTAAVVVSADRYAAGRWAEAEWGASVHVLDDGFQHVQLARDVDILLVSAADLEEKVLPFGRLREPLEAAASADALLVSGSRDDRLRVQSRLETASLFEVVPSWGALRTVQPFGVPMTEIPTRVLAVAGIAKPERFFQCLPILGFDVTDTIAFRDHHWFDDADLRRIEEAAVRQGATVVVTTEKDAVRLESLFPRTSMAMPVPWAYLPYEVRIDPDASFRAWLGDRVQRARRALTPT